MTTGTAISSPHKFADCCAQVELFLNGLLHRLLVVVIGEGYEECGLRAERPILILASAGRFTVPLLKASHYDCTIGPLSK